MALGRPIEQTPNIADKVVTATATAGQTQFTVTGGYRINHLAVYRNGVRLVNGNDYTALDGVTVTLMEDASNLDVLEFQVFDTFNVSDALLTNAASQTVNGDVTVNGTFTVGANGIGTMVLDTMNVGIVSSTTGITTIQSEVAAASTSTGALQVMGGVGIGKSLYVGGNLSVGGTVTYEDVTNIDSIGIVTGGKGLRATTGGLVVTAGVSTFAGITTVTNAAAFHSKQLNVSGVATVGGNFTVGDTIYLPEQIVHTGDTNTKIKFPDNDTISFETGGSERFRIDSSGRVNIGNTSNRTVWGSQNQLQIEGLDGATSNAAIIRNSNNIYYPWLGFGKSRGTSDGSSTIVQDDDILGVISWHGADGSDMTSQAAAIYCEVDGTPGSNDMPGRLEFHTTADGAESATERLRIDSSGRVLIGTTAGWGSDVKLHLGSSANTYAVITSGTSSNGVLAFSDDGSERGSVDYDHDGDHMLFKTAASERVRIDSAGRVGIGTESPQEELTIMSATPALMLRDSDQPGSYTQVSNANQDMYFSANGAAAHANFIFRSGNNGSFTERIRIGTSGEIGIAGANYGSSGQVITSAGSGSAVSWATPAVTAFASGANNRIITATSSSAITGSSSFTWDGDQMSVYAGTDDTNATLLLVGKTASGGVGQAGRTAIIAESTSNSSGESAMHFRTRNSSNAEKIAMTINGSQFVGIGTENPVRKLHVNDDNSEIALYQSGNASGSYVNYKLGANGAALGMIGSGAAILSGGADAADFGVRSSGDLCISSGGHAEKLRLTSNGEVLIGHTAVIGHNGVDGYLQLTGTGSDSSSFNLNRFSADNWCPFITFGKSRNATKGSHTIVQDGDYIGYIQFAASDGVNFDNSAANIICQIDGTPGTDDTPGRLIFQTCADGTNSATERLRITSAGVIGANTTSPISDLHTSYRAVQNHNYGVWSSDDGGATFLSNNAYINSAGNWVRLANDHASDFGMDDGNFYFRNIGAGTGTISWNTPLTIASDGTSTFAGKISGAVAERNAIHYQCTAGSGSNTQGFLLENTQANHSYGTVLRLHINTAGQDRPVLTFTSANASSGDKDWMIGPANGFDDFRMNSAGGGTSGSWGTTRFRLEHGGTFHGSGSNDISDQRLKDNITTISNASTKIKALRGVTFNWQSRTGMPTTTKYGFIAQEMDSVIPDLVCKDHGLFWFNKAGELVAENNESRAENPDGSSWDIHMSGVIPVLVESLKEALAEIETLKTENTDLKTLIKNSSSFAALKASL